jgi:hypothetical protein
MIDPDAWPPEMQQLTPKEQLLAIYLDRGVAPGEAAALAGYKPTSRDSLSRQAWNAQQRPHVRRALAALRQRHAHKETLRYGPTDHH